MLTRRYVVFIAAILILKMGVNFMSNTVFGFILFLVSIAIFTAILVSGAPFLAGHVALAILLICMFGMGLGVTIIERD
jgi:hypothetical protein